MTGLLQRIKQQQPHGALSVTAARCAGPARRDQKQQQPHGALSVTRLTILPVASPATAKTTTAARGIIRDPGPTQTQSVERRSKQQQPHGALSVTGESGMRTPDERHKQQQPHGALSVTRPSRRDQAIDRSKQQQPHGALSVTLPFGPRIVLTSVTNNNSRTGHYP